MDFLKRFDFVVDTRFHGVMFAIQAGISAGCITHDGRTTETFQTMGIPYIHYRDLDGPLTHRDVMDYFSLDAECFVELRCSLLKNVLGIGKNADVAYGTDLDVSF